RFHRLHRVGASHLLEQVISGESTIRELAAVDADAMKRMHAIAVAAFTSGRFEQASTIFAGLEALDRREPLYALHLGHARARLQDATGAIEALTRYISAEQGERIERVRAILMRAMLRVGRGEENEAQLDVAEARRIAGDDPEAAALVAELGS